MGLRLSPARPKMVNPRDFPLGVILLALIVSGCAGVPRATENGEIKAFWSKISDKSHLRTRGVGVSADWAVGRTARRATSRNGALVSARYELLAVIKGVKLEGGTTIMQLMEKNSLIRELARALVRGGEEVKTEWTAGDDCVVTLELKRSTVERLFRDNSEWEKELLHRAARDTKEIERLEYLVDKLSAKIIEDRKVSPKPFWEIEHAAAVCLAMREMEERRKNTVTPEEVLGLMRVIHSRDDGH
ncbi:MAG: hypothetical protein NDJ72_00140 [Elusimicrobia bacterium]|nr:hypothetical protein [Elusimicrobiota bacterium]